MLPESFYQGSEVTEVARLLLGKRLITRFNGLLTSGVIVETEAYSGAVDRASHAFGMKETRRTSVMFEQGGKAYVYLCYGIHHLFNIVTNTTGHPDAVLIRALQPDQGIDIQSKRRNLTSIKKLASGPGKLSEALGIRVDTANKKILQGPEIWLEENIEVKTPEIVETTRIGVDYAGEDKYLPWRYYIKGSEFVSRY